MHKDNTNIHIGQVIHTYRKLRQLTLSELASQMNISYQQLQKYEKGANKISADKLFQLARILKANPVEFFPGYCEITKIDDSKKQRLIYIISNLEDEKLKNNLLAFLDRMNDLFKAEEPNYSF